MKRFKIIKLFLFFLIFFSVGQLNASKPRRVRRASSHEQLVLKVKKQNRNFLLKLNKSIKDRCALKEEREINPSPASPRNMLGFCEVCKSNECIEYKQFNAQPLHVDLKKREKK